MVNHPRYERHWESSTTLRAEDIAPDARHLAASICRACNMHDRLLAVCEAIEDSFDANGDYRYHTAEHSVAQLVAMARSAVAEAANAAT